LLNPAKQGGVKLRLLIEKLSARVRHRIHGLQRKKALLRHCDINTPTDHLLREPIVIARRIIAEEREPKAILPHRRAVTAAGVARRAEEDGHHVLTKTNWRIRSEQPRDTREPGDDEPTPEVADAVLSSKVAG